MRRLILGLAAMCVCLASSAGAGEQAGSEVFGGMGLTIAQLFDQESADHRGAIVVLGVIPGGPADGQGIARGDVITHIDGQALAGMAFPEIVMHKMRGPVGQVSELLLQRAGSEKPLRFKLKRAPVAYTPAGE